MKEPFKMSAIQVGGKEPMLTSDVGDYWINPAGEVWRKVDSDSWRKLEGNELPAGGHGHVDIVAVPQATQG